MTAPDGWIELCGIATGRPFLVRKDLIAAIMVPISGDRIVKDTGRILAGATVIYVGATLFQVKETPEEILELLK